MEVGRANGKCPANPSILMEPALLVSAAFERESDKVQVPSWRDGAMGEALQIRMAKLMGERYFDYELYKSDKYGKAFKTAADWVARRPYHFKTTCDCCKSVGGSHWPWIHGLLFDCTLSLLVRTCFCYCTLRFARLQPAIKAVFHQLFGLQTSWDPAVLTRWKEIMVGNHDESIRDFSDHTPEQLDTLPALLESRAEP